MFLNAIPVWLKDREEERNLTLQFKTLCPRLPEATICIATSGIYNLWVNGSFAAYGPARAGKGSFRMDRIDISRFLTKEENTVVLDVCGFNAFSFEIQKQPSFLQAELLSEGQSVAWTGSHFTARVHPFRRRRTQRYSFQRQLTEAYSITSADSFLTDTIPGNEIPAATEAKKIIPRYAPYPQYEVAAAQPIFSGTAVPFVPEKLWQDRSFLSISDEKLTGWPIDELEVFPTDECQYRRFDRADPCQSGCLAPDSFTAYRLPHNMTGMLRWQVTCRENITLYVMFDEILTDGRIDFLRMDCANVIRYDLCPGTHTLQTFHVYTMQYLQFFATGSCTVENPVMVQYKHPPVSPGFLPSNPVLQRITDAAIETYRQNAVDIFMDCPSRERAGWLCDSFFTSRVAHLLTGNTDIETGFLENFLHDEHYAALPEGMLPMCYPADHMDGVFIPQWAMWLVLELREYKDRGGDPGLIERFRPRITGLLAYFARFENPDGLLQDLPGWNFVEWSMANQLTKNVNYPTNMLYAATLRAAAELYGEEALRNKADTILTTVRSQSFDGQFFVDNAVLRDGKLVLSGERTEVCQYYAFFFGAATPETHPELLRTLIEDFGPHRAETGAWPQIHPANAFIGNYLRLDILTQLGYLDTVRENIEGYFLYMADKTGTLWENVSDMASCNHGFASYVLCWLDKIEGKH